VPTLGLEVRTSTPAANATSAFGGKADIGQNTKLLLKSRLKLLNESIFDFRCRALRNTVGHRHLDKKPSVGSQQLPLNPSRIFRTILHCNINIASQHIVRRERSVKWPAVKCEIPCANDLVSGQFQFD